MAHKELPFMKKLKFKCCLALAVLGMLAPAFADVNILIVGSSASYSDRVGDPEENANVQEKAFNPSAIASQLQSIISGDSAITGNKNVVFEDIYRSKYMDTSMGSAGDLWPFTYYSYSLMQYYMWPDGKTNRLNNLRGAYTNWDYVVIMGDPYLMANMPGVFAEGVSLVAGEVASGTAEPILLAQWPENSSTFSVSNFNEVVYRVGESAGLRVVPGGKAWETLSGQDTSSSHPTPKGSYLAAAAIYSELFDRSAKTSSYNPYSTIADHALSIVQANHGVSQYTGTYTNLNVWQMKYLKNRFIEYNDYGSSTEDGFHNGLVNSLAICGVSWSRRGGTVANPLDFSYSRGTDCFEADKQYDYLNRLDLDNWTYGFPIGDHSLTGGETMRYGIDKRRYNAYWYYNGTDLGIAYSMIMTNQVALDCRGIPVRLIWANMHHADLGFSSHRDTWHLSNELDRGVGSFMYTLLSGRCPVGYEPSPVGSIDWNYWFCRKIGYELAWRMSHLTTRVPGFMVYPASATSSNVTPTISQTLAVSFAYAPTSDVTVAIASSDTFKGIVSPSVMTFTPQNYSNAQTVTVLGQTGPATACVFNVTLTTTSDDFIYDNLSDSWEFLNTRQRGPLPSDIRINYNGQTVISGDTSPIVAWGTDFEEVSSSTAHTFTITNVSSSNTFALTSNPKVTLNGSVYFSLTQDAAASTLAAGDATTFEITYNPLLSGAHSATVTVVSTDSIVPSYSFAIKGARASTPLVATAGATPSDATTASLSGVLTDGVIAQGWICWGESDAGTSGTGAWDHVVPMATVSQNVSFATTVSGLRYGIVYDYRIYVSSDAGTAWSGPDSFHTLVVSPPAVSNMVVQNIGDTSAGFVGQLDAVDAVFALHVYYSTNNNASPSEWLSDGSALSVPVGTYANVSGLVVTQAVSSLTPASVYYYTFMATNEVTNIWASANSIVRLPSVPTVTSSTGATAIDGTSATLRGQLTDGGLVSAWFCWGSSDAGTTSTSAWDHVVPVGAVLEGALFSDTVSGLSTNMTYWYRCYVSNSHGSDWSDTAEAFGGSTLGTGYRMQITFTNFAGRGTLTNFPALVRLTRANINNYAGFIDTTDGWDLRFWPNSSCSGSELPYEVEAFSTSTNSYIWVKVPELSNNVSIWASWGSSACTNQEAYTTNGAVWSEGFAGVWHLKDDVLDSTSNGNDGIKTGSVETDGMIGRGQLFGGTNADINCGNDTSLKNANAITASCWMRASSITTWGGVMGRGNDKDYELEFNSTSQMRFRVDNDSGQAPPVNVSLNTWYYMVGTYGDGVNAVKIYQDGVLMGTKSTAAITDRTENLWIGSRGGGTEHFGEIDEARVSTVARSSNWVWACYMNQGPNHESFAGYGTPFQANIIANSSPTNITGSSAALNGYIDAGSSYDVYVYWGVTDGESNATSWTSSQNLGSFSGAAALSYAVSGLAGAQPYYYTMCASNAGGAVWASPSWGFTTLTYVGPMTTNYSIPHDWLDSIDPAWTNSPETVVTNDPDGDGFDTWEEYWSGTNPTNADSRLIIDQVMFDGGNVLIEWRHALVHAGIPPIEIQACTNLSSPQWSKVGEKSPTNGVNQWQESFETKCFYRLVVPSVP